MTAVGKSSRGRVRQSWLRTAVTIGSTVGVLLVAGCSGGSGDSDGDRGGAGLPERAAPERAGYSVLADPVYSANLTAAQAYVPEGKQRALRILAATPVAVWLATNDSAQTVRDVLRASATHRTVPVFVAYNIPLRDDGGHSGGGGESTIAYVNWIRGISGAIGQGNAVVVLEPDALAHVPDLSDAEAAERISMLATALKVLAANTNTAVYLDAGNSSWRSPQDTAALLTRISQEDVEIPGIALNVANYRPSAEAEQYGRDIEKAYGTDLFVLVDNSRNGAEVAGTEWCNPHSQTLGTISDRRFDPDAKVEEVYVKVPGESDGPCGISDKPAGEFDGNLLVALLP